jgi:hypothetical protein
MVGGLRSLPARPGDVAVASVRLIFGEAVAEADANH